MARAIAEGFRVRIECEAGTFYLQPWEARELGLGTATSDLLSYAYKDATQAQYDQAVAEHRAWLAQRRAELGIEED